MTEQQECSKVLNSHRSRGTKKRLQMPARSERTVWQCSHSFLPSCNSPPLGEPLPQASVHLYPLVVPGIGQGMVHAKQRETHTHTHAMTQYSSGWAIVVCCLVVWVQKPKLGGYVNSHRHRFRGTFPAFAFSNKKKTNNNKKCERRPPVQELRCPLSRGTFLVGPEGISRNLPVDLLAHRRGEEMLPEAPGRCLFLPFLRGLCRLRRSFVYR